MSVSIISAIRKNANLHGSLFQAAKELAHRADGNSGQVTMSYSLLAAKIHQSRRTAIRHIHKLLDMGIIRVQRFWGPNNHWGINKYVFLIRWERPAQMGRRSERLGSGVKVARTLPNTEEREKFGSLKNEEKMREEIKDWLTPGSELWKLANEF
jgi:hypothetical protein